MLAFRSFSRTARKMAGLLTAVGLCAAVAGLLAQSLSPAASNWRLPAGKDIPFAKIKDKGKFYCSNECLSNCK